jgi:phage portal protein BeeE
LQVPAVSAAVSFMSRTLAALPLHSYRNTDKGPVKIVGGLQTLIHEAPNAEWTAFKLRQYFWQQVFLGGRGLLWIERSGSNITGIYPINPTRVLITRDSRGRTTYELDGKPYPAADIIDVPFMLKSCGVAHYSPIILGREGDPARAGHEPIWGAVLRRRRRSALAGGTSACRAGGDEACPRPT